MSESRSFDAIKRVVRTPYSERLILSRGDQDIGVLDLHYPERRSVVATLLLLDVAQVRDEDIPVILKHVDEVLLPDVSLDDASLQFTVVRGAVIGTFTPTPDPQ